MTVERLPDGTLLRRAPVPFTPAWLAKRAGRPVAPEHEPAEDGWCPLCGYAVAVHDEAADCPDETTAREAWGA